MGQIDTKELAEPLTFPEKWTKMERHVRALLALGDVLSEVLHFKVIGKGSFIAEETIDGPSRKDGHLVAEPRIRGEYCDYARPFFQ